MFVCIGYVAFVSAHISSSNKCSHDDVMQNFYDRYPEAREEVQALRSRMVNLARDYLQSVSIHNRTRSINGLTTVQIPVVWHVLYTTQNTNTLVTKAQIDQEMIWLNDWYSAQNVNFGTASNFWINDIAQAEDFAIQFVLATRDPNGDSTGGIEYRETNVATTCGESEIFLFSEGGLDIWDPLEYMNIYTCPITALGYAYLPTTSTHFRDGVVLEPVQLGDSFYSGSTISHEVGHWLGLDHTFANTGCDDDDSISDTPNTDAPAYDYADYGFGCPGQGGTSDIDFMRCGNIIMVQNNMDYNYEPCLSFFSKEQVSVMRNFLTTDTVRGGLSTSNGLNPNCATYDCDGKTCGPDGCGGVCGDCSINVSLRTCDVDQCVPPCPNIDCVNKNCGPDGCGGVCGTCGVGEECNANQQCESPNDTCSEAVDATISTTTQSYFGTNEVTNNIQSCSGNRVGAPLWYTFEAFTSGTLTVSTSGSLIDTTLAIFSGSCGSLSCIDFNDDISQDLDSSLTISFTSGTTYFIAAGGYVDDYNNISKGPVQVNFLSSVNNPGPVTTTPSRSVSASRSDSASRTRTPSSSISLGLSPSNTPSRSTSEVGPNPSASSSASATASRSTIEVPSNEPETPRPSLASNSATRTVPAPNSNSASRSRQVAGTNSASRTRQIPSSNTPSRSVPVEISNSSSRTVIGVVSNSSSRTPSRTPENDDLTSFDTSRSSNDDDDFNFTSRFSSNTSNDDDDDSSSVSILPSILFACLALAVLII